jgi:hypothetical protein
MRPRNPWFMPSRTGFSLFGLDTHNRTESSKENRLNTLWKHDLFCRSQRTEESHRFKY